MKASVRQRILGGLKANTLGLGITTGIQILSVPLLLTHWGVEVYGEWLLISTIPAYVAMSDIGLASVAGNEMTMEAARGNRNKALIIFQSVWLTITLISISLAIIIPIIGLHTSWQSFLGLHAIPDDDAAFIVAVLIAHVLVSLQGGVVATGFRCAGKYAVATHSNNAIRALEFFSMAAIVVVGYGPRGVAIALLVARVLGTWFSARLMRRSLDWLHFGIRSADRKTVVRLLSPGIAYMAFPLGHALYAQVPTMALGIAIGPAAVVLFTTVRTLARVSNQVINIAHAAIWPELTIAFGEGNRERARSLHRKMCQIALWVSTLFGVVLTGLGGWIIQIWTTGKVAPNLALLVAMLVLVAVNSFWWTSAIVVLSINKHNRVAYTYLASTIALIGILAFTVPAEGVMGAVLGSLFIDIVMVAVVLPQSLQILAERKDMFLKGVIAPPTALIAYMLKPKERRQ